MGAIMYWYDRWRRRVDIKELWPACKEHAKDIPHAKAAFFYHIIHDHAWTRHYTEYELWQFVEDL